MKCFIGKEKKLENNTIFYRELEQIDKTGVIRSNFFVHVISRAAAFCSL